MPPLLLVMIGGALGAGVRFGVGSFVNARLGTAFPWGTLAINVSGGLIMGALAAIVARGGSSSEALRLFAGVGVLGGYTTFSSYSLETLQLVERGAPGLAAVYALGSMIAAFAAVAAGAMAVRLLA